MDAAQLLDRCFKAAAEMTTQPDAQACLDRLSEFAADLGFKHISFLETALERPKPGWFPRYMTTADPHFISHYMNRRLDMLDPVVYRARTRNTTFSWEEARESESHLESREVWDAANQFGYRSGIVVPAHGVQINGNRCSVLVTFFWDHVPKDLLPSNLLEHPLRMVIHAFHDRLIQLDNAEEAPIPKLTARERECLTWAGIGKTAEDTAGILGTSKAGVTFHIKNAMDKLGASCKTQAVVKAMALGLIRP